MTDRIDELVAALTPEERTSLLAGRDLWSTAPVERLGIPSIRVTDGPNGVRGHDDNHGRPTTSYPVGAAMGATWDPDLVERLGRALGAESRAAGASVQLGPTMNIPRVPIAGRNFECFSEAPVLSGLLAAAYVRGVQAAGVAACVKHVVCNDQETDRFTIDVDVDGRALREVYLEPFRIAVRDGAPWAAMSAYNWVGGTAASAHPLLDDVLREEYGFDGAVVSDWYGTYGRDVVAGGVDLEMPGPARWHAPEQVDGALAAGEVTQDHLDTKARRVLQLVDRVGGLGPDPVAGPPDADADAAAAVSRLVARSAMVLLANDGVLPIAPTVRRVAVIGEPAMRTPHQGGGSAAVRAPHVVSVLEGLSEALGPQVEVVHSLGTPTWRLPPLVSPTTMHHDGGPGWLVEYVDGDDPAGEVVRTAVTTRSTLTFFGPGDRWIDHDRFAARVTGRLDPATGGRHELSVVAQGRVRLSLDGEVVAEAWEPGEHDLRLHLDLVEHRPVEVVLEFASTPGPAWRSVRLGLAADVPGDGIAEAARVAAGADVAVVVVGLGEEWETEGADRPDMRLPRAQDELVAAVAAAQPATAVVVTAGSPVELPWLDDVGAVLHAWYGGQEVGHAVADVVTGTVDPGGRLPVVWPGDARQHPGMLNFPGEGGRVRYGEGVLVGQRAYDHLGIRPLFRLGHGCSYTSFGAEDVRAVVAGEDVAVRLVLRNTGDRHGTDVVQVVAHGLRDGGRLVGFARRDVVAGGAVDVEVVVGRDDLRRWDPGAGGWVAAAGELGLTVRGVGWEETIAVDLGGVAADGEAVGGAGMAPSSDG